MMFGFGIVNLRCALIELLYGHWVGLKALWGLTYYGISHFPDLRLPFFHRIHHWFGKCILDEERQLDAHISFKFFDFALTFGAIRRTRGCLDGSHLE
jgi:hypothetical protein